MNFRAAICAIALACAASAAERPNVVIVFADDMGYGDPTVYNPRSRAATPNIDALAAKGMRFTDAHTASSVCTPSRYGLLTGRYPWRSRLPKGIVNSWGQPVIARDRTTLATMFQQLGYRTAAIGKWHLGWDWPLQGGGYVSDEFEEVNVGADYEAVGRRIDFTREMRDGPTTRGFDYYFGDDVPNFPPYAFIENDRVLGDPSERMPRHKSQRAGPMMPKWDLWAAQPTITSRAIEWLEERAAENASQRHPFFLYVPLLGPHTPIVPGAEHRGTTEAGPYGDWVRQMDAVLGRVVRALEEGGLMDDTIVLFSSDNGSPARSGIGTIGQTHTVTELYSHVPNAPWRGLKSDAWEAGHRVPFIVRWDGRVQAGAVNDQLVCLTDVFATLAEIVEVSPPEDSGEDSFSMAAEWLGRANRNPRRSVVHHSGGGLFAYRKGDWKLILGDGSGGFSSPRGRIFAPEDDPGPVQLYLLSEDPRERRNVASTRRDKVSELLEELRALRTAGRSTY